MIEIYHIGKFVYQDLYSTIDYFSLYFLVGY